jgi:hypothetical protein
MIKRFLAGSVVILFLAAWVETAPAGITLDDFESGNFIGWSLTGSAWTVGGTTNSSPSIAPAQGNYFARSGAPNVWSGVLAESNVGTALSPAYQISYDTLTWMAVGWNTYFQILDATFNPITQVQNPHSDSWTVQSVNLIAFGLKPGDTFYFKAVDEASGYGYSWLAFDDLKLSGTPVPIPCTIMLVGSGLLGLAGWRSSRKG